MMMLEDLLPERLGAVPALDDAGQFGQETAVGSHSIGNAGYGCAGHSVA